MKAFVTGSAGFLGRHLVYQLKLTGWDVVPWDIKLGNDLADVEGMTKAMAGCFNVFHLAANASVRGGWDDPARDLRVNTVGTANVLEAMRKASVRRIAYVSSSAVYGSPKVTPTPEDAPFPVQTSLYGASKLAAEGLVQAYGAGLGFQTYIFRPVPILGGGYRYGHIKDFVGQLLVHPRHLDVLGTGLEAKTYIDACDLCDAMRRALDQTNGGGVFNVGGDEVVTIGESAQLVCELAGYRGTTINFKGGPSWRGDNSTLILDTSRIRALGWKPVYSVREAYEVTIEDLLHNREEVFQ